MTVVWRLGLILFGFAVATLTAAVLHVPRAAAQYAEPSARSADPSSTATRTRPSQSADEQAGAYEMPARRPRRSDQNLYSDPDAGDQSEDGFADASADAPDQESNDPTNSASGDPADGEPAAPQDGLMGEDGVIDLAEPQAPNDGDDPNRDTRPVEDVDVFANPPAGHDPLLFQIEDIDPIETDRRPARLARFEPYDPVGIKIGSFVFFPEIEIGGLATNNVLSSPTPSSDIAAEIRSTSRFVSNWTRHAVELRGTTVSSFYDEFATEDDRAWGVEARGRLDITRRTNLQGLASHDLSQESRSGIDANTAGERADVTVDRANLALNHRFNRLSVQLRGAITDTAYSDANGISNADRDTLETTQTGRATWEFKPTLSVYAEQEWNQRDKEATPPDGISRSSKGTRTRIGLDFGATGAILRGTISAGYGQQNPDDSRLKEVDAFLFDANLAWRPSEITSFLLTAQSDIYETTTELSGGVITHTVGLEARHAFRRYLIATAGLAVTNYDYDATTIRENELITYLGAEYYASPELVLFTRYQHLNFDSNEVNRDYDSDEIRVGARLRR
ncbi:MAG: outer membrane beta-barrel protein [Hyphomicrobium sp.]|uniref:outer membrane beta-barrel protein n=1 Tax=Hyphomicrobium sp. TaxID=82 RepID=UPI0025BD222B|nr:outer membrane beta-barrel protein [Hyphomicrobium sp.]MBX9861231.1 outer membrane beta-barrel protein [Hyphomicrobium sp.]